MNWDGEERRSQQSLLARGLVVAKDQAEEFERELSGLPRHRFRRRAELERALSDARERERAMLSALGGAK